MNFDGCISFGLYDILYHGEVKLRAEALM
jgi:hypothetical protein